MDTTVSRIVTDMSRLTQMGLKNRDGKDIAEVWKDGIRTYLGMTFHGFPNAFMVYSPHGKVFVVDCAYDY